MDGTGSSDLFRFAQGPSFQVALAVSLSGRDPSFCFHFRQGDRAPYRLMFWEDISGETQAQLAACGWEVAGAKGFSFDMILTWWSIYKLNVMEAACEVLNFQVACWWCGVPKQRFPAISPLGIMGSRNWWFGDPRTLLYRVKPLYRRVQWFSGIYDICIILMKFCVFFFWREDLRRWVSGLHRSRNHTDLARHSFHLRICGA